MTLTDAIKQHINSEVEGMLSEIDLDAEVEKYLNPDSLHQLMTMAVDNYIKDQVLLKIRERIFEGIHKRVPLIDATIESKVVAFMMGFTGYIDQLETDVNNKVKKE